MIYWDRVTLKNRAKIVLKNTYWMTFLALFIIGILGGSSDSNSSSVASSLSASFSGLLSSGAVFSSDYGSWSGGVIAFSIFTIVMLVVILLAVGFNVFLGNVFQVGKSRFLTMCRYGDVNIGEIFFSFKQGRYMNTVKTMFIKNLYIFLWSLLLIIPGIIKSYEYWMVSYILAENPNISKERALEISSMTTKGEKWDMFVLNLSFIGWTLLGTFVGCGIGVLFVNPYVEATNAELYGALRYKAVMTGLCSPNEIGRELFPVE